MPSRSSTPAIDGSMVCELDASGTDRSSLRMFEPLNAAQIRVSIDEIEPQVWRHLVVPLNWNLEQLHLTIQAVFNWWNYHLHEFRIGGLRYGDVELLTEGGAEGDPQAFDERLVRLRYFEGPGTVFGYIYDFGDNWRHTVEIEECLAIDVTPKQANLHRRRTRPAARRRRRRFRLRAFPRGHCRFGRS
jgi:hypothetical protein